VLTGSITVSILDHNFNTNGIRQQQFEYAYVLGAVCPGTGATEAIISSEAMREHMSLISKLTPEGCHAVVVMDGWVGLASGTYC
jgi:hypothetical protein